MNTNLLNDFLSYLKYEQFLASKSIEAYHRDIKEYLSYFNKDIRDIKYEDILEYLSFLYDKNLKNSTQARKISALKTFYKYLEKKDIINENVMEKISLPKKEHKLVDVIEEKTLLDFLNSFKNTSLDIRNKVIFTLLYATGLRVSELVNVKIKDIDLNDLSIRVLGKGSKERIVYFNPGTSTLIDDYLNNTRKDLLKNNSSEYLLINKNGTCLSVRGVQFILKDKWLKFMQYSNITPHQFRHTFATHLLDNGMDLRMLQELLGHENLETTQIYTKVSTKQLTNAINSLQNITNGKK
ncbi:MAG: tyrosine-type recombinase/integrase [Bacilli bacterium]|jgi:site-specific recombinase XerD|nr:tyrosine-type recombinase/integrase [Bacilli bacterium]